MTMMIHYDPRGGKVCGDFASARELLILHSGMEFLRITGKISSFSLSAHSGTSSQVKSSGERHHAISQFL
jgi:hypothetical protein